MPFLFLLIMYAPAQAQTLYKGRIIDAITKEPVYGASLQCTDKDCGCSCLSSATGDFEMLCKGCTTLTVSSIGYQQRQIEKSHSLPFILLTPAHSVMNEVVVTASRGERIRRSKAPVAISLIHARTIQENLDGFHAQNLFQLKIFWREDSLVIN